MGYGNALVIIIILNERINIHQYKQTHKCLFIHMHMHTHTHTHTRTY